MSSNRNILRNLRIDEFSLVDKGAQEPGFKPVLKRDPKAATVTPADRTYVITKGNGVLTTEVDGHVHMIDDGFQAGMSSYSETSTGQGHCHPYVITDAGVVTLGASYGHTHEIDARTVEPDDATKNLETAPKENAMDPTALRKALAEMTPAQFAHYRSIATVEGQETFLAKSAAEREQIVKAAADADAPIYTADDGTVVRKSMDPTGLLVKAMKDADEAKKAAQIEKAARERVELEKRAEPLTKHFPGKIGVRAALVKAIESIADQAERDGALAMLKAGNDALGKGFATIGHTGDGTEPNAEAEMKKMAAEYAKENKVSLAKAVTHLLDHSPEFRALKDEKDRERLARA